mgnify:CR=1 FL=1
MFPETGLWPLVVQSLDDPRNPGRPWSDGEFSDPIDPVRSAEEFFAEVLPGGFKTAANSLSIEFTGDRRIVFATRTADAAQSLSGDTVIIDEAARANPLDLFIPMSMAKRRIVLVGDQAVVLDFHAFSV